MSVFERLNEIRSNLLAARSFERLGRDNPAVVRAVATVLAQTASLASGLPDSFVAAQPGFPWQRLSEIPGSQSPSEAESSEQVWAALAAVEPLSGALFSAIGGAWDGDPHAGGNRNNWFDSPDGGQDYSYGGQLGSTAGAGDVLVPGVGTYACSYLSSGGLWIAISQDAADALRGSTQMDLWARRLGMGRVRKDGSTPLEPPPDRIWVQRALGEATLVGVHSESDTGHFYVRLGEFSTGLKSMVAAFGRVQVMFAVSEDFLPRALHRHQQSLIAQKRMWGGLIATTIEG